MRVQVPHAAAERGRAPVVGSRAASRRGRPLDREERAQASAVFGRDFSGVRIHDDVDMRGAEAATIGSRIHLRGGAAPQERARILGHELAHVVQQAPRADSGPAAGKAALEREADRAAEAFATRQPVKVEQRAPARAPQFTPVTVRTRSGTRTFEVGDVLVNSAASTDIRTHGNLLPSADQAHVTVYGGRQLGYEPSYTTPEDPFRWNQFKAIVDNDHIDINAVSLTTTFPTNIVSTGSPTITNPISLAMFAAGGFTLLTLARQQAIQPGRPLYVVSPDAARDKIYYETGAGGRGIIGSNSLAHELFGHFGLARVGAPFAHGATIPASAGVRDPFGQPYAGSVNDYIANFAGASGTIVQSPTFGVSAALLATAITNLQTNGAAGLQGTQASNSWTVTPAVDEIFIRISVNYRVLRQARVPPPAPAAPATGTGTSTTTPAPPTSTTTPAQPAPTTTPAQPAPTTTPAQPAPTTTGTTATTPAPATAPSVPTTAQIETSVLTWYSGLTPDQQWVFRQYVRDITSSFLPTRPDELARTIEPRL